MSLNKNNEIAAKKPSSPNKVNPKLMLKKHINLINISQAGMKYQDAKIFDALLLVATKHRDSNGEIPEGWIDINSSDLRVYAGMNQVRRKTIDSALKRMNQVAIESVRVREDLGDNIEEVEGSNLITEYKFLKNVNTNDILQIKVKLPELIRTAQAFPKVYANLNLEENSKYRSGYAYFLDPFLRVNFNKYNFSKVIALEDYRKIVGVPDNKLTRNDNLIKIALERPLKEIFERHTEMRNFVYQTIKKGKAITGIEFTRKALKDIEINTTIKGYKELLHKFNYTDKQIDELRASFSDERIYAVLQYSYKMYMKKKETAEPIKDLKVYAWSCLQKGIELSQSNFELEDEELKEIKRIEDSIDDDDHKLLEDLSNEHNQIMDTMTKGYFENLSNKEKELLVNELRKAHEREDDSPSFFDIVWEPLNGFQDQHNYSLLYSFIIDQGFIDEDVINFPNYVYNKTGRRISKMNSRYFFDNKDAFKVQKENKALSKNDKFVLLETDLVEFLMAYKKEVSKLILNSKMGDLYRSQYTKTKEGLSTEEIIDKLALDEDTLTISLEDVLKHHNLKLSKTPEVVLTQNNNNIATGKDVLAELYSLLPKKFENIFSLLS
jgi:hypothetical protein